MIQIHGDSFKAQFLLATSKPNSHWHYFIKKKRAQDYQCLAKKKISCYRSKKGSWQSSYEETHWELSWGLCSHIINPWNTWTSFCITTSIIYTFYTRGKTFKPTSSSSKLLETWTLQYGIHHSKCYLQKCFETYPIVSNITTNCPKAHCKYLWRNPKKILLIKVHEE